MAGDFPLDDAIAEELTANAESLGGTAPWTVELGLTYDNTTPDHPPVEVKKAGIPLWLGLVALIAYGLHRWVLRGE